MTVDARAIPAVDHRVDDILMHTLGLDRDRHGSYRNHFVAGPGHHDMPLLVEAERRGYMKCSAFPHSVPLPGDSRVWYCTEAGKARAAAAHAERFPPLTRSKARYRRYLDSCSDYMSFGDYLKSGTDKIVREGGAL